MSCSGVEKLHFGLKFFQHQPPNCSGVGFLPRIFWCSWVYGMPLAVESDFRHSCFFSTFNHSIWLKSCAVIVTISKLAIQQLLVLPPKPMLFPRNYYHSPHEIIRSPSINSQPLFVIFWILFLNLKIVSNAEISLYIDWLSGQVISDSYTCFVNKLCLSYATFAKASWTQLTTTLAITW